MKLLLLASTIIFIQSLCGSSITLIEESCVSKTSQRGSVKVQVHYSVLDLSLRSVLKTTADSLSENVVRCP